MPRRLLDSINTYKGLCDEMIVSFSDIIDITENSELHPKIALANIKEICRVLIRFYEDKYYEIEETQGANSQADNVVLLNHNKDEGTDDGEQ